MEGLTFQTASQSVYHTNKINEIGNGMKIDNEENIFMKLQSSGSGNSSTSIDLGSILDESASHSIPYVNNNLGLINPLMEEEFYDLIDPLE